MTKRSAQPKRHADHITETVELAPGIRRTYSAPLKEHALWVENKIVATAHAVSVFWPVVSGDPEGDGRLRRPIAIGQTEQAAIATLESAARNAVAA